MKRYLNRQEKDEAYTLVALIGFLDKTIKDKEEKGRKGVILRGLKLARYWATNALDEYFNGLDQDERDRTVKEMKRREVVIVSTAQAQQERKQVEKDNEYSHVLTDDFYEICGHAWGGFCKWTCPYRADKEKDCPIWRIFLKYDVPVLDENTPEGRCPYRWDKEGGGKHGEETV